MNGVLSSDILKPSIVLFIKSCTFSFFILSIFISSSVVFADTIFVPTDQPTIQAAINFASPGDTVVVDSGTYQENILFPGTNTITLVSANGAVPTIIDGDHNGSVVTFAAGNNSTMDGFTITNGSTSENGGGVLIGSSSAPTIANCIIADNEAFAGGGISCGSFSKPFITNSTIQNNSVTGDNSESNGGGIHASTFSTPTITNCIIKNNTSDWNGGGLSFNTADKPTIVNCIFSNNTATVNGGAISFQNSAPIITNSTFNNNRTLGNGGAIACSNPLLGTAVANSILWGDSPTEISCDSEISVTYSDIQRETTWSGTGNINADPKFVDAANGDLHLKPDSPCIDAGDNLAPSISTTDIDGNYRRIEVPSVANTGNGTPPIVDIGAFEFTAIPCTDDFDSDGDGIGDACDNCPDVYNPDQSDGNNDGIGDACDIDNDGFSDNDEEDAQSNPQDPDSIPVASELQLITGYNQVSFPAETMYYGDLQTLMATLGGSTVIDRVLVFDRDTQQYIEAGYLDNVFVGTNLSLPPGEGLQGLIIYAGQDHPKDFPSQYCQTWDLKQGINLVGSGGCIPEGLTAQQLLAYPELGAVNVSSIQRFNPETGEFEARGFDAEGNQQGIDFPIIPGEGYLLQMKQTVPDFRP